MLTCSTMTGMRQSQSPECSQDRTDTHGRVGAVKLPVRAHILKLK